jgi:hypothetical protein
MKHEDKIGYMKIAGSLCNFGFDRKQVDLLVSLYEAVIEKKGDLTMRDVAKIEADVKSRADIKNRSELLDKVSEKL